MASRPSRREVLSGIGAGAVSAGVSRPAFANDFYQGKTVTVIVGFAPGGGVDTTARTVARHLVRFVPGQPNLVVQNMEGAGGLIAATHLDRRVTPDGLTLAVPGRSWFVEGVVKSPGVTFDSARFAWIGSPGAVNSMMYVRASTGITSLDDLKRPGPPLTFGALGSTTTTALVPVMLAAAGLRLKVVVGYGSTARVLVAIEQGEVDGVFTVEDSFARRQDLIRNRFVIPIMQNKPIVQGLPLLRDVLPKSDGPLLSLVMAQENIGLPLVGPPGIPSDRVEVLRKAFLVMAEDKDYQADSIRSEQPVGSPISGAQLAAFIDDLVVSATPEMIAAYRRLGAAR